MTAAVDRVVAASASVEPRRAARDFNNLETWPPTPSGASVEGMKRPCEVCSGLEKIGLPRHEGEKTRRLLVGTRIVTLCDAHAKELRDVAVNDVEELAEHFREPGGRRSLVGRRAPLDRRVFPPRPEGRRKSAGRRHDDALE